MIDLPNYPQQTDILHCFFVVWAQFLVVGEMLVVGLIWMLTRGWQLTLAGFAVALSGFCCCYGFADKAGG